MLDNEPTNTFSDIDNGQGAFTGVPHSDSAPPPVISFMAPPDPEPQQQSGRRDGTAEGDDVATPSQSATTRPSRSRSASNRSAASAAAKADGKESRGTTSAVPVQDADPAGESSPAQPTADDDADADGDSDDEGGNRRRRGRRGRGRGRSGEDGDLDSAQNEDGTDAVRSPSSSRNGDEADEPGATDVTASDDDDDDEGGSSTRRRRRRRRRSEEDGDSVSEDGGSSRGGAGRADSRPDSSGRNGRGGGGGDEEVRGISGSTRLEAKRQRRRDGRDTGRRRAPILSEAEFLARREAVDRAMVIRQSGERTQIAVLEDDVLVEHYITQASANSFAGSVYLGRVQNVLPSMEAAFVDIGKGRNAVLYAGEVNWDAAGLEGRSRNIETAMKSGDSIVVQVTKDPLGHKGARLTSQISLPGRYLVFVPNGSMTGISRKLPDVERSRLKAILKKIVPEEAGVIIRTAAEGASEEELTRDVNRLTAQWEVIQKKAASSSTSAPSLLYQEPDLAIRVIRDVFNEDFSKVIVSGIEALDTVEAYVAHVAPDLTDRVSRHTGESDVFADLRIDEQLAKALDRKVWLPSGGSLVIDRTEAMTVIDVNTGKYIGSGGNLEQTVTRNNLEAAEEIVRQLRLRDIGGIIVIDFIDMVLESNRDLVLRRLTECLSRDRTRHQVAEVTSLGLVQMTRKRVGQGLLEVYSHPCEHCNGRGIIVQADPVDEKRPRFNGDRGGGDRGDRADRHRDGDRNRDGDRARSGDRAGNRDADRVTYADRDGADSRRSRRRGAGSRADSVRAESTPDALPDGLIPQDGVGTGTALQDTTPPDVPVAETAPVDTDQSDTSSSDRTWSETTQSNPSANGSPEQSPTGSDSATMPSSEERGSALEPTGSGAPGSRRWAAPAAESADSADVTAWIDQEASVASTVVQATPRRRGRRAASRPAGPPGVDG